MAVLSATELADLRQRAAAKFAVTWTKPQVNAALQAIEDAAQSVSNVGAQTVKQYFGSAIETAAPTVFTAQQKDNLFILWTFFNARRGGVI